MPAEDQRPPEPETSIAGAASFDGSQLAGRIWPYHLAILLLPAMVLLGQDNSLFPPPGQIDTWVYLGFFRNLVNFKRDLFPNTYYGSRLSWILPGWLIHSLFTPVVAAAVLHLGVLSVAALSLFSTLRRAAGARGAFLTTLVFSASPQVWYAIGWDYVDGAGMAYCLLTMALLTRAADRPGRLRDPVLAGITTAGLIYSNLFWASLTPLLLLYYVVLARSRSGLATAKALVYPTLGWGAGFLLTTLLFCAINHQLDGTFWFYGPSLKAASSVMKDNPWYRDPWTSHGVAPWLWFTVAAAVAALALLPFRWRRQSRASHAASPVFAMQLLFCLAWFAYLQYGRGVAVFGLSYYATALLPFVFLVIGCSFWRAAATVSQPTYLLFCVLAAVVFGVQWGDYSGRWTFEWPAAAGPMALAAGLALAAALVFSNRKSGIALAIAGFAIVTSETRFISFSPVPTETPVPKSKGPHEYREDYERVMHIRALVESQRRNRKVRFWYDEQDPASPDYTALNSSYLYLFTAIPTPFPRISCDTPMQPGILFVASSMRQNVAAVASGALDACLRQTAQRAVVLSRETTESRFGAYQTAILSVERDPAKWHLPRTTFDPAGQATVELTEYSDAKGELPPAHWKPMNTHLNTDLRRVSGGIELKTPAIRHAEAATYGPLVIRAAGRYRFALRYQPRAGRFAFGIRSGDGSTWLVTDVVGHRAGLDMERECWQELQAGQTIRIEIANNHDTEDVPASLLIKELTGLEVDLEKSPVKDLR